MNLAHSKVNFWLSLFALNNEITKFYINMSVEEERQCQWNMDGYWTEKQFKRITFEFGQRDYLKYVSAVDFP